MDSGVFWLVTVCQFRIISTIVCTGVCIHTVCTTIVQFFVLIPLYCVLYVHDYIHEHVFSFACVVTIDEIKILHYYYINHYWSVKKTLNLDILNPGVRYSNEN